MPVETSSSAWKYMNVFLCKSIATSEVLGVWWNTYTLHMSPSCPTSLGVSQREFTLQRRLFCWMIISPDSIFIWTVAEMPPHHHTATILPLATTPSCMTKYQAQISLLIYLLIATFLPHLNTPNPPISHFPHRLFPFILFTQSMCSTVIPHGWSSSELSRWSQWVTEADENDLEKDW